MLGNLVRSTHILVAVLVALILFSAESQAITDQEILIPSTIGKPSLNGFLAVPETPGKHRSFLILLGSGPGSTDNPSRAYNPFHDLAVQIAEKGFVVLRFDKRGTGYNEGTGKFSEQTLEDFEQDSRDALTFLSNQSTVDSRQIIVFGHSLGTVVAAKLAAELNLAGLILSAGQSETILPVMEEQQHLYDQFNYKDPAEAKQMQDYQLGPYRDLVAGTFDFSKCDSFRCTTDGDEKLIDGQSILYWKQVLSVNMKDRLSNLKHTTSVLCLGGSSDWIMDSVHAEENGAFLMTMSIPTEVRIIDHMDHFLSEAATKEASIAVLIGDSLDKLKFNETSAETIGKWLNNLVAQK